MKKLNTYHREIIEAIYFYMAIISWPKEQTDHKQKKCTKPINEVKTFDSYNIIIT